MLKVKSCCGCSLRRGSIVIMMIIFPLQIAVFVGIFVATMNDDEETPTPSSNSDNDADEYVDELVEATLFSVYVTATGLYGVIKKKPKKIVHYLMVQIAYLSSIAGVTISLMVTPLKILKFLNLDKQCMIPLAITLVLIFSFLSYFFVVVHSYYRELKRPYPEHVSSTGIPLRVI